MLQCFVTGHLAHSWPSVGFRLRTWQQGSASLSIIALHWITVWIPWGLGIPIWATHNLWTLLWMTLLRTERSIEKILDYGQLWKNIGEQIILTLLVVIKDLCQSFQCGHCPLNTSHSFTAHYYIPIQAQPRLQRKRDKINNSFRIGDCSQSLGRAAQGRREARVSPPS